MGKADHGGKDFWNISFKPGVKCDGVADGDSNQLTENGDVQFYVGLPVQEEISQKNDVDGADKME